MNFYTLKAKLLDNGLVVPRDKPVEKEPERDYGPIEIKDENTRKEVSDTLTSWRNHSNICGCGGGIVLPDVGGKRDLRINLIEFVGKALLGKEWSPEIKC